MEILCKQRAINRMKTFTTLLLTAFIIFPLWGQSTHYIKVEGSSSPASGKEFNMGTAVDPQGNSIHLNGESMLFNGKPVLPVMGEFHFSRFPDNEWRKELLKMKAGGINIVASYIFWIHHEEIEGEYNWKGERNLQKFVETCQEVGMPIVLRIGPWCHGEARNGGIPEWMVTSGIKLRNSNPDYLNKLQRWYAEIFQQVEGMMWKDGGPVIGIQLENEYRGPGAHLITLKEMAQEIGFDVPIYTRTGWPALTSPIPFGEIIPLYGDYSDGFWDRSTNEMPGDYGKSYVFRGFRNSTVIATEQLPKQAGTDNLADLTYPYFTCELGGGMMTSYHRRINIHPMDIYSMILVRLGSGSNLPGYYMYHGGTNPQGKTMYLSEMQNSLMTNHNDLPLKSYDFQAPLGEFGQINPHYHMLRQLHQFLHDFGSELTSMNAFFPNDEEMNFRQDSLLRWAVRSNGQSGYLFVNNYHRLKPLTPKNEVQFTIGLPEGDLTFPEEPLTIPSGASFFMPFNMDLNGSKLHWATAQPIAHLNNGKEDVYVFTSIEGIRPDFVFESGKTKIKVKGAKPVQKDGKIELKNVKTGMNAGISLLNPESGKETTILLLDPADALTLWKGELNGKKHLFISTSDLTWHEKELELNGKSGTPVSLSIYPKTPLRQGSKPLKAQKNGIFAEYTVPIAAKPLPELLLQQIKEVGLPLRTINKGKAGVTEQPSDADFEKAAVWQISFPEEIAEDRDLFLHIPYTGDVARIYMGDQLLTDNFFNGKEFLIGLRRFAPEVYQKGLTLKILPLQKNSPIYLQSNQLVDFHDSDYLLSLPKIEITEQTSILLNSL